MYVSALVGDVEKKIQKQAMCETNRKQEMCLQTALEFMLLLIQSAAKVGGDPAVYKQKISHSNHVLECDMWKQRVKEKVEKS